MVFSSTVFLLLFLPIVFVGNLLIKKEYSNYFLLLASLFFYAWGEPYLVLLMIVLIILNYFIGLFISKTGSEVSGILLTIGIVCNLGALGYYKYSGLAAKLINSVLREDIIPVCEIALPIGISFYTFQALSYLVDVYKGETRPAGNPVKLALYISFFPQLIAGPIVKYRDINEQIDSRSVTWIGISDGFKRFIYGLGKKVLIANTLGMCVDTIYSYDIAAIDSSTAWLGALAYSFQIYYDFSGYSDMAIGLGKMFGFRIPENFDYPYLSRSITEFWRRWHISLGSWFREYVYIPLGGNRKGKGRTYINLIVVFLLTGLWHGADLSFVIWGLYHVAFILLEKGGGKRLLDRSSVLSVFYTFFVVNIGWVLFRADNTRTGLRYIARMLIPWKYSRIDIPPSNYMDYKTVLVFILAILGAGLIKTLTPSGVKATWKNSVIEALYCVCLLILCLASVASDTYNPFIYFQF